MQEIDVPSYFLCPISMQLMTDPVTVATGITYDREHIEKWLFSCKNNSCPVTKQVLQNPDLLTPNHNLRRLIQSWCILNDIERIPTPKQPLDKIQIFKLINEAKKFPQNQLKCLKRLRSISQASSRNKMFLEENGAVEFLSSVIKNHESSDSLEAIDEALNVLYNLQLSEKCLKKLVGNDFLDSLLIFLKCGNFQSRGHAIMLLKSILKVVNPAELISLKRDYLAEVINVLHDKISPQASKAALKLLVDVCPWGRNRIKAVDAGAIFVLIELLLEVRERRLSELILVVLDQLCGCAEGRAELVKHGAGLALVSKKVLRVSHVATDRAVRILASISRFSVNSRVLQEMLQVGVVSKLCLVLQVEASGKTKERVKEILRLHSRVWKDASCIPSNLLSSYPS